MNFHQIIDVGIAGGGVLIVLAAWAIIKLTFRRGRDLEEA